MLITICILYYHNLN